TLVNETAPRRSVTDSEDEGCRWTAPILPLGSGNSNRPPRGRLGACQIDTCRVGGSICLMPATGWMETVNATPSHGAQSCCTSAYNVGTPACRDASPSELAWIREIRRAA